MKSEYIRENYSDENSMEKKNYDRNQKQRKNQIVNLNTNSKMTINLKIINSVLKMDKIIFCLLFFVMSINTMEARFVGHKNFENFCRNFPLHMVCMGAFAGGGKRSFDMENISRDYDQSAYKEKNLIERILSDIGSFKSNRDHKVKEFLKTKAFEYDSESSLINPSSDEYNDDLSLNQKVQFLRLLRKLSKKYQNEKNNINV